MKKTLLMSIIIGLIFSNCTKEQKESEIIINYKLLDDVSPVKTILSVDNDLHWAEWILNDSYPQSSETKNSFEFIFENPGVSNVKINAVGVNGEK